MNTTSSLTLTAAALVAVAGFSVPVFADDVADTSFNDDLVRATLAERGLEVSALAESFNTIRATVTLPDGSSTFQYFDINTLQPVDGSSGGNTRVLSDLDVGPRTVEPSLNSLTWVDPDDQ